jgi:hypothetical protein
MHSSCTSATQVHDDHYLSCIPTRVWIDRRYGVNVEDMRGRWEALCNGSASSRPCRRADRGLTVVVRTSRGECEYDGKIVDSPYNDMYLRPLHVLLQSLLRLLALRFDGKRWRVRKERRESFGGICGGRLHGGGANGSKRQSAEAAAQSEIETAGERERHGERDARHRERGRRSRARRRGRGEGQVPGVLAPDEEGAETGVRGKPVHVGGDSGYRHWACSQRRRRRPYTRSNYKTEFRPEH